VPNSAALRVGVIGCGFFAVNQVRAWASTSDVFIAALCDCHHERADRLASELQLDVPTFGDAAEMVDKVALDFLDIITTPATHPALVALAANRKVPAIVQKPMALSLEEGETMVEMMEAAHLPLMVHENYRFQAPIAAVGEIVRSGEIGQPVYGHIASRTAHDIYKGQPYLAAEKRLILADVGVHVLDVARFLLGEAERVYCETQRVLRSFRRGHGNCTAPTHLWCNQRRRMLLRKRSSGGKFSSNTHCDRGKLGERPSRVWLSDRGTQP
jgi:D-apiose dehydrogenase